MKLLEHQGKRLLAEAGLATPDGAVIGNVEEAGTLACALGGRIVVKAQVLAGKRGKAGAVRFAESPAEARQAAAEILDTPVDGLAVTEALVEQALPIAHEMYAAVLNDPASKSPLILFSTEGGIDIEDVHATTPEKVIKRPIDIRTGLSASQAAGWLDESDLSVPEPNLVAEALARVYELFRQIDATLVEINPLVVTNDSRVVAADAKVTIDPGALTRHTDSWLRNLEPERLTSETPLEAEARGLGLQYLELGGEVGVLANGAGLTMSTLDAVHYYGGRPANFLEIGGDAYTKATAALRLVLANPNVRSLLVNFCGAFARTDVMTDGVVTALESLRPDIPVFFSIHGTGEDEAVTLIRDRLGMQPYEHMDDAVRAAVAAVNADQAIEYEGVH